MSVNSDFSDLLSEFNGADVRYLVVGGYAVFFHGQPTRKTSTCGSSHQPRTQRG